MGQHKYNPTAVAAKNGELPPKPERPSKREIERDMYRELYNAMVRRVAKAVKKVSEKEDGVQV